MHQDGSLSVDGRTSADEMGSSGDPRICKAQAAPRSPSEGAVGGHAANHLVLRAAAVTPIEVHR